MAEKSSSIHLVPPYIISPWFHEEMSALTTNVLSEMLHCKFPAIYVLFVSILEGNTRERTWLDQHRKSVHVPNECNLIMKNNMYLEHLQHVPPLSVMDSECYLSLTAENKAKVDMMVSRVGRLLSDDLQLQALYHTVSVNKNWTLVIVNFSAQDASILKISDHLQEDLLRIPKHPQRAKFG